MFFNRSFAYWILTFFSFPIGGLAAITVVGSIDGPTSALLAGALAGAVIGTGQWLALRFRGVHPMWILATAVGMAVGSAVSAAVTDAGTSVGALVLTGVITGILIGIGQGVVLRNGGRAIALWTAVTGIAWALGWLVTANVIVDAERGYVNFGASGALLATVITGLALPLVLAPSRTVAGTVAAPLAGEGRS